MPVELQEGKVPHVESGLASSPAAQMPLHADSLGFSLKDSNSVGLGWGPCPAFLTNCQVTPVLLVHGSDRA